MAASKLATMSAIDDSSVNGYTHDRFAKAPENPSAEDRATKRRQRGNHDGSMNATIPAPANDLNRRQSAAIRRVSGIRDYKPPLGPRPPEFSNSRRVNSESVRSQPPPSRTFPPNANSEPFLGLSSRRNESRFDFNNPSSTASYAQDRPKTTGQDMLSSSHPFSTPATSRLGNNTLGENERPAGSYATTQTIKSVPFYRQTGNQSQPALSTRPSERQSSAALRAAQLSLALNANATALSAPLNIKGRRQSQFPIQPIKDISARQPRKSVGPGILTGAFPSRESSRGRLEVSGDENGSEVGRKVSESRAWPRMSLAQLSGLNPSSIRPPPSVMLEPINTISSASKRQEPLRKVVTSDMQTNDDNNLTTPYSQRERKDSESGSRKGLPGLARAVSPTDIRKSRRMSGFNVSTSSSTHSPSPEVVRVVRTGAEVPLPYFKPKTPPSSRTTPDHNIRFSAGRSLSSRSSYNSMRPASTSFQQPPAQNWHRSKSPNGRSKIGDTSSQATSEIVPPVPAIPKVFESPSSTVDEPFFESFEAQPVLSSTLLPDARRTKTLSMAVPAVGTAKRSLSPESKFRRRFTLGPRAAQDGLGGNVQSSKQTSQQSRLPPLNVSPLSHETAECIDSMARRQLMGEAGDKTPPPQKPPTTPMTASRATFSKFDFQQDYDKNPMPRLHSSTSQRKHQDIVSRTNSPVSLVTPPNRYRQDAAKHDGGADDPTRALTQTPSKIGGARHNEVSVPPSAKGQAWRDRNRNPTTTDQLATLPHAPPTSQGGQTTEEIRKAVTPASTRRMSLRFRRTSSKTPNAALQHDDSTADSITDALSMPPPKLPASKTWADATSLSTSLVSHHYGSEIERNDISGSLREGTSSADGAESKNSSTAIPSAARALMPHLNLSQRSLSARNTNLPAQDQEVRLPDQETAVADEEMRKLASKRKEFEATARELDALQKRAWAKKGVTPEQAAKAARLNIFERGEITEHKLAYFCGTKDAKKVVGDTARPTSNYGFDDERGDYSIIEGDHLAYRYEIVDILGKGSFGQVVRCIDHKSGKLVAIKIIRNKKRFHQQALIEVNILRRLREWDPQSKHSMINFTESFMFRSHLCIATELLDMNLYEFIKAHDFRGFSLKLIRRFTRQMISCMCVLQSHKVIHCDLKPENILLAHPLQSAIKTIDFGSSCFENEKVYTYIQSRFYRSPEVILGMDYGMPIDMWSMGCILAELFTGYPIFPGENEQEQLACIMEVFGPPEKHLIERSTRKKVFFDSLGKPRTTVSSKGKRRRPSSKTLQQAIKCDDEAFLDFLAKCLRWDPEKRLKPDEAMVHDFITGPKNKSRTSLASSPMKKPMSFGRTPSRTRPLPEPPLSAGPTKRAVTGTNLAPSTSPLKVGLPSRRQSMMNVISTGIKRNSNGTAVGSALPRSVSEKPNLASAAAIASLRNR